MHVTLRVMGSVPSLRGYELAEAVVVSMYRQRVRRWQSFQVVHYSIQDDHLHLIVEAIDEKWLARGMASLKILLAKAINRAAARTGRVFTDRYHRRDLKTPMEVWNALRYVLMNLQKHGRVVANEPFADPRSSAATFDGFSDPVAVFGDWHWPSVEPRTWLLGKGWRRHGPIPPWLPTFGT